MNKVSSMRVFIKLMRKSLMYIFAMNSTCVYWKAADNANSVDYSQLNRNSRF